MPGLLTDLDINGYVAIIIYGGALLHVLITAPRGIAGQISVLIGKIRALVGAGTGRKAS